VALVFSMDADPDAILAAVGAKTRPFEKLEQAAQKLGEHVGGIIRWLEEPIENRGSCAAMTLSRSMQIQLDQDELTLEEEGTNTPVAGKPAAGKRQQPQDSSGILLSPDLAPEGWVCYEGPGGRKFWHHLALGPVPWQGTHVSRGVPGAGHEPPDDDIDEHVAGSLLQALDMASPSAAAMGNLHLRPVDAGAESPATYSRRGRRSCPGPAKRGRAVTQQAGQPGQVPPAEHTVQRAEKTSLQRHTEVGSPRAVATPPRRPHVQDTVQPMLSPSPCERRAVPMHFTPHAVPMDAACAAAPFYQQRGGHCDMAGYPGRSQYHRPVSVPARVGHAPRPCTVGDHQSFAGHAQAQQCGPERLLGATMVRVGGSGYPALDVLPRR